MTTKSTHSKSPNDAANPTDAAARLAVENRFILLMASMQFIHIVDFMMVMPLGPDFARTIGMDASKIGVVGGVYTFAAALSTLICYRFLDRVERKRALLIALAGLAICTALTALAWSYSSLLALRALTGLFGGPVAALAMATISDTVAEERRGRAFGFIGAAFSAAAVVGVPIGLELALRFGWQSSFVAVGAATGIVWLFVMLRMPSLPQLKAAANVALSLREVVSNKRYRLGLSIMFLAMFSIFLLIPHLSGFWQFNRGYPREGLGLLYMVGGVAAFVAARFAGWLVDARGAVLTMVVMGGALSFVTLGVFVLDWQWPVMLVFVAYMSLAAGRSVPSQTLSSMVPEPRRRAGYMALQSTVQSLGSGCAAIISSMIVNELADHVLVNLPIVGIISIVALLLLIWQCARLGDELASNS